MLLIEYVYFLEIFRVLWLLNWCYSIFRDFFINFQSIYEILINFLRLFKCAF